MSPDAVMLAQTEGKMGIRATVDPELVRAVAKAVAQSNSMSE